MNQSDNAYSSRELTDIVESMPLLSLYSSLEPALKDWALIFRDHFVENSVGIVLAMQRAGVDRDHIFTLDKGDRTKDRTRIANTFRERGYRCGVLDNGALRFVPNRKELPSGLMHELDSFVVGAHRAGKRVMVIDDGGLILCGYGSNGDCRVDAAIELTMSGLKRVASVPSITIPVVDLASSRTKALLAYPEIAASCVRRLRDILSRLKIIGRAVTVVGFGSLGSRLARSLRNWGARVTVVDLDISRLIAASEEGFCTRRNLLESVVETGPFLIASATGEPVLSSGDVSLLPNGVFLAPFATRDFSVLLDGGLDASVEYINNVGMRFTMKNGRTLNLLGDGRSMNLFEADAIPNQGYDAYRAATLVVAKAISTNSSTLHPGLNTHFADTVVARSGLLDVYYERYLT